MFNIPECLSWLYTYLGLMKMKLIFNVLSGNVRDITIQSIEGCVKYWDLSTTLMFEEILYRDILDQRKKHHLIICINNYKDIVLRP